MVISCAAIVPSRAQAEQRLMRCPTVTYQTLYGDGRRHDRTLRQVGDGAGDLFGVVAQHVDVVDMDRAMAGL